MSSVEDNFVLPTPNHKHDVQRQLDDGVRCLMLDTYWTDDAAQLCHGVCGPWGISRLGDTLETIQLWLEQNQSEILTIIFQANITEKQLLDSLIESRLAHPSARADASFPLYVNNHKIGEPWPTIGEMVDANQRLVLLTDDPAATNSWQLHWPDYAWETPYGDPEFPCEHGRGDPNQSPNQLFILNHYSLCSSGGCAKEGSKNNEISNITSHAFRCVQDTTNNPNGQLPTFINLDYYHLPRTLGVADAFWAINEVNNTWTAK
jgi:hypothetical protein